MDITRPPLDRQVAPAPWLVYRAYVDAPGAIREILAVKPNASVDEIAETLAARGTQVSRMVIAMWLNKLKAEIESPGATPRAGAEADSAHGQWRMVQTHAE